MSHLSDHCHQTELNQKTQQMFYIADDGKVISTGNTSNTYVKISHCQLRCEISLSYDIAFIQRILSCHKYCMTTLVIINVLACTLNIIDNVHVNNTFFY